MTGAGAGVASVVLELPSAFPASLPIEESDGPGTIGSCPFAAFRNVPEVDEGPAGTAGRGSDEAGLKPSLGGGGAIEPPEEPAESSEELMLPYLRDVDAEGDIFGDYMLWWR